MKPQEIIKNGGIGIIATDTIYGIVGSALKPETVERIYALKSRDENKPFIILIPSIDSIVDFGISINEKQRPILDRNWPGPVSIILSLDMKSLEQFKYLHRGTNKLAFRLPDKESLQILLKQTGPLVAPSANPQGLPPARTISEAEAYFGDALEFYIDTGESTGAASKLIELDDEGNVSIIRA